MLENLPDSIGHALHNQRAGLDKIAFNQIGSGTGSASITVHSMAFADHAPIPEQYTADGVGISPPVQWSGVPSTAAAIVLIVEDADSPTPKPLVHAIVVDLPVGDGAVEAGALESPDHEGNDQLHTGRNSYLTAKWLPPDPPPGHGAHRYAFQVFALAAGDPFSSTPGREEVLDALRERAVASGCLIGTYERPDGSIRIGAKEEVVPIAPDRSALI
jgi:Raf kinase inhibitor-like YbhB/YbcL family protein